MSAPTLYQHYKTLARLAVFQADAAAIVEQGEATRAAFREVKRQQHDMEQFDRVAARLSARAIRIANRELAASNG
jgi:hypothetical protein